jgi:hypothetical protein
MPRIARLLRLEPAAELLRNAGQESSRRARRRDLRRLQVEGETVILHDQNPLIIANAQLEDGWTEGDFVAFLDEHVFFWPGTDTQIVEPGRRLLDHYDGQDAVLRVSTEELFAANADYVPLFCPFNSGAPRQQGGKRGPRGPALFVPASEFPRPAGAAMELVFRAAVTLPPTIQVRTSDGSWHGLSTVGDGADVRGTGSV